MSESTFPDYLSIASVLQSSSLSVTPAELHGLLVGMLSGGLALNDKSWQPLLCDYTNEGMGWPDKANTIAESLLNHSTLELTGTELDLFILLPNEDAELMQQADALSEWISHFISGLGLVRIDLKKASADAKEALADLEEISKLGIDKDDDMEEQAGLLEQVIEHVKACVLTIHAEFGTKPEQEQKKPTIH